MEGLRPLYYPQFLHFVQMFLSFVFEAVRSCDWS